MDEETHVSEDGKQYLVVRIGNLEECKYAIGILDDAEIVCRMDVAESVRPELAKRGYYIVIVETAKAAEATAAIEARLHQDLDIEKREVGEEENERCPACGEGLPAGCTECPECGLCFE